MHNLHTLDRRSKISMQMQIQLLEVVGLAVRVEMVATWSTSSSDQSRNEERYDSGQYLMARSMHHAVSIVETPLFVCFVVL